MTKLLRSAPSVPGTQSVPRALSVPRADLLRWAVISGLLTLIVLGSAAGSQFRIRFPDLDDLFVAPEIEMGDVPPLMPPPEGSLPLPEVPERDYGVWLLVFVVLFLLSIIGYVVFRFFWRRRGRLRDGAADEPDEAIELPPPAQFSRADVADIVAAAQARMAGAGNPSDAVVAGWLAFEEAAATRGWVREPHETTTEFTDRLLAASPVPVEPVATLRGLYQKVRFGGRLPTDDDVTQAHGALTDIAESIRDIPDPATKKAQPVVAVPTQVVKAGMSRNKWGED